MTSSSPSYSLRRHISFFFPLLGEAGSRISRSRAFADLYPSYLLTLHSMIRATVPLMERGLEICEARAAEDPLCEALGGYLRQHIREEMHHDQWLLDDLDVLGHQSDEVLAHQPSPTIAAMVGSQYYWMNHFHPIALLGYIAAMEGSPPQVHIVDTWPERTGLPAEAFRTIRKHAILDPHHKKDLDRLVDTLPLESFEGKSSALDVITKSAVATIKFAARAVDEVWEAPLGSPVDLETAMTDYEVALPQ